MLKGNKTQRWRSNHIKLLQPNFLIHWIQNNVWMGFQNWNTNFFEMRMEWEFFFFFWVFNIFIGWKNSFCLSLAAYTKIDKELKCGFSVLTGSNNSLVYSHVITSSSQAVCQYGDRGQITKGLVSWICPLLNWVLRN